MSVKNLLWHFIAMSCCLLAASFCYAESGFDENGFSNDPGNPYEEPEMVDFVYQIDNAGKLYWLMNSVNNGLSYDAVLTADIVVNEKVLNKDGSLNENKKSEFREWFPIGTYYEDETNGVQTNSYYYGVFDGQGHTISGLYFDNVKQSFTGLFGRLSSNAVIRNISVVDSYFNGAAFVGGVCGYNEEGSIESCYSNSLVCGEFQIGGLCGVCEKGRIAHCLNVGNVKGTSGTIGGVCGYNISGVIDTCGNEGYVFGESYVGGICGESFETSSVVKCCYNSGYVAGLKECVGGVCGLIANTSEIMNSYNIGTVSVDSAGSVGGICGACHSSVGNSYSIGIIKKAGDVCNAAFGIQTGNEVSNCFYLADYDDGIGGKTASQFRNGEVAYLLNDDRPKIVFRQTLGTDHYPTLLEESSQVFKGKCNGVECYLNDNFDHAQHEFDAETGFCKYCHSCKEPDKDGKGVYQIANAGDLYWFANYVNNDIDGYSADAVLVADIVVNENVLNSDYTLNEAKIIDFLQWIPIGTQSDYNGSFDGKGHVISGLYLTECNTYSGLFAYLDNATVKNVGVVDSYYNNSDNYIGGICGYDYYSSIENCYFAGYIHSSSRVYTGGICGGGDYCPINNCFFYGKIDSYSNSGYTHAISPYSSTNCYYLVQDNEIRDEYAKSMNANQFASGKVAYLLNGKGSDIVFFQTIGTDSFPTLSKNSKQVYEKQCVCVPLGGYSNSIINYDQHEYGEGNECLRCGSFKEPLIKDGVFQISNADELYAFMQHVNKTNLDTAFSNNNKASAMLVADIVVNKRVLNDGRSLNDAEKSTFRKWSPIGYWPDDEDCIYYEGTFDGNGHTISGIYFEDENQDNVGLFGYLGESGVVKNVDIVDSYFYGHDVVGAVCGSNESGTIDNCNNYGVVENKGEHLGGLCGNNNGGDVIYCHNYGLVTSTNRQWIYGSVGGICGYNQNGTISYCSNFGQVNCYSDYYYYYDSNVGGICGNNYNGTISNCQNIGQVWGEKKYVGGVCGNNNGVIANSLNIAEVSGYEYVGGLCGQNYANIKNSFNVGSVVAQNYNDDLCGMDGGKVENCYFISDKDEGQSKTASQFKNGEVAYMLNKGQSKAPFFQTIGIDTIPTLSHLSKQVYAITCCGVVFSYSNVAGIKYSQHDFGHDGFCQRCGSSKGEPESVDGVYQIACASDLYWFMEYVNGGYGDNNKACAVLTADIVVNENVLNAEGSLNGDGSKFRQWVPIGCHYIKESLIENVCYKGKFNGKGHVVSGLYVNDTTKKCVGLFGRVDGATIDSVGLVDSYFNANSRVGGLVGYCQDNKTVISNSYNAGTVIASMNCNDATEFCHAGGICGYNKGASLYNCYNSGSVYGSNGAGGLCGINEGTAANCYNVGCVMGDDNYGGLVGVDNGTIVNCYYLAGGENIFGAKSSFQFQNGEVAFLLNGNQNVISFRQTIGKEKYPVLSKASKQVYKVKCVDVICYSNENANYTEHEYVDGVCSHCGTRKEPESINGVYQIANANDLYWFMEYVNNGEGDNNKANAVLTADIVVNKDVLNADGSLNGDGSKFRQWFPIGYYLYRETKTDTIYEDIYFKGTFNGNGHIISGLFFNDMYQECVGLFGNVDSAKIENVGVVDSYFKAYDYVGGVCGYVEDTAYFSNCFNSGTVSAVYEYEYAGGLCGYAYNANITNCYNTGLVRGEYATGGLCGCADTTDITNCYNTGLVRGENATGGLCGCISGVIENCYYVADVDNGNDAKTDMQFRSGMVAYLLNGNQEDIVFHQTIGVDNYPVLDNSSKQVYEVTCAGGIDCYSNENVNYSEHDFVNGICSHCGAFKVPDIKNNVFQISSAFDLYWFMEYVNGGMGGNKDVSAELVADIVVNENVLKADGSLNGDGSNLRSWFPIGYNYDIDDDGSIEEIGFKGYFNGNGHTISGLYFNNANQDRVGLFGVVDSARIENVGIIDSYFNGCSYVGGLCGYVNDTVSIINSFNSACICSSSGCAGGLCGRACNCNITNCYNTVNITDVYGGNIGGLCGTIEGGVVSNCFNFGGVSVSYYTSNVGGLFGYACDNVYSNCFYNSDICACGAISQCDDVVNNMVGKPIKAFGDKKIIGDFDSDVWNEGALEIDGSALTIKYPYLSSFGEKSQYVSNYKFEVIGVKKDYFVGERLSIEIGKVVMYDDKVSVGIGLCSNRVSFVKEPDMDNPAKNVVVSLLVDSILPVSFNINVHAVAISAINILDKSFTPTCYVGDNLDLTNAQIEVVLNNDRIAEVVHVTSDMISGFNKDSVGCQEFSVNYEGVSAIAGIEVMPIIVKSISLLPNSFPEYCFVGDTLDITNAKIDAACNDIRKSGIIPVSADMISGFDGTKAGKQTIRVAYWSDTVTYTIVVKDVVLKSVSFLPNSFVKSCYAGDTLDFSKARLAITYNDARKNDTIAVTSEMISGFDSKKPGTQFITCTYQGKAAKSQIFVNPVNIKSMVLSQNSFVDWLYVGDSLDLSKAVLTIKYNDARKDTVVAVTSDMISGFGINTAGRQVINVTYQGKTITDTIEVVAILAESISLVDNSFAKSCYVGDSLDLTNAKINVVYNDARKNGIISVTDVMVSGFDCTKVGMQTITVTYQGKTATVEIEVLKPVSIIDDVASINIYARNRTIVVEMDVISNGDIFVFDINGRMVAKQRANSTHIEMDMPIQGMYIVRVGEMSTRVVLK